MWNEIKARMDAIKGKTGFYYKNLVTGETVSYRGDEIFLAASIMKLPLLVAMLSLQKKGQADFSEKIWVREKDKLMESCGALKSITGEFQMDVASLARLMINISDSSATNILLDRFQPEIVGRELSALGFRKTQVNRKFYDEEREKRGIQNWFSPDEIGILLEQLYHGTLIDEESSKWLVDVLLSQQINHKIPGYLPEEVEVAHKTGEEDMRTHDVGIVFAPKPFIVCFASDEVCVPEFEIFIRETSKQIYDAVMA